MVAEELELSLVPEHCEGCSHGGAFDCTELECECWQCCDAHCEDCGHHKDIECDGTCGCCCNDHCTECEHCDGNDCEAECGCCCSHCSGCEHWTQEDCERDGCDCGDCDCEYGGVGDGHCDGCEHGEHNESCNSDCACCHLSAAVKLDTLSEPLRTWVEGEPSPYRFSDEVRGLLGDRSILPDIVEFYLLAEQDDDPYVRMLLREHAKGLAQRVYYYAALASIGEARHAREMVVWDGEQLSEVAAAIVARSGTENAGAGNREGSWSDGLVLLQLLGPTAVLTALEELFKLTWCAGNFGGLSWARVARLAREYAEGEWTDVAFVDLAVNLAHNGGWVFDKYYQSDYYHCCDEHGASHMNRLLNYRQHSSLRELVCVPESLQGALQGCQRRRARNYEWDAATATTAEASTATASVPQG